MKPRIHTNEYKLTGQDLGNVLNLHNIEDILPLTNGRRKEGVFLVQTRLGGRIYTAYPGWPGIKKRVKRKGREKRKGDPSHPLPIREEGGPALRMGRENPAEPDGHSLASRVN